MWESAARHRPSTRVPAWATTHSHAHLAGFGHRVQHHGHAVRPVLGALAVVPIGHRQIERPDRPVSWDRTLLAGDLDPGPLLHGSVRGPKRAPLDGPWASAESRPAAVPGGPGAALSHHPLPGALDHSPAGSCRAGERAVQTDAGWPPRHVAALRRDPTARAVRPVCGSIEAGPGGVTDRLSAGGPRG